MQLLDVCLTHEILFAKIFNFFNIGVFVRTSTNFAQLATFKAVEFVDQPIPKALVTFVCQTTENISFKKHSIL